MKKEELKQMISNGEDSYTQFKVNITNAEKLAQEIIAFSNAKGGVVLIGIDDFGKVVGLDNDDIRRINQLIGNVINTHVLPPVYPLVMIENIENKKILLLKIDEGVNKPYSTNSGIYLTKAGSDKRKISPQELRRLFAESKNLFPDEEVVHDSSIEDIDVSKLKKFLKTDNIEMFNRLNRNELVLETLLANLELLRDDKLTLAGVLLFSHNPQRFKPSFYVDCCYFDGNDISVTKFISKKTIKGTFDEMFEDSIRFVVSQLRVYQIEKDFNSNGELEINQEVLTELIVNALVHRDYYINSSIKIFMFHDRIEIITPGKLVNSLTVEKIKNGIAIQRNPILSSICKSLLPYTGYGSGIKRVLTLNPDVEFINDIQMEQFKSVVYRKELGVKQKNLGEKDEKLGVKQKNLGEKDEKLGLKLKLSKNRQTILDIIKENRSITITLLSEKVGISTTAIENNIKFLKESGLLKRVGSDKAGYWEVDVNE